VLEAVSLLCYVMNTSIGPRETDCCFTVRESEKDKYCITVEKHGGSGGLPSARSDSNIQFRIFHLPVPRDKKAQ
jgi:hypothetical protein